MSCLVASAPRSCCHDLSPPSTTPAAPAKFSSCTVKAVAKPHADSSNIRLPFDVQTNVNSLRWGVGDRQAEREIYFKSHISWWEHSSHFRLIGRGVPQCVSCFSANVQIPLFGLPQGKSLGPHVKDQELNPRPHTPRPAEKSWSLAKASHSALQESLCRDSSQMMRLLEN